MDYYIAVYEPSSGYHLDRDLREQDDFNGHAQFMDNLVREETIILGGPLSSGWHRVVILRSESKDKLLEKLSQDPWIKEDILKIASIAQWNILLDGRGLKGKENDEPVNYYLILRRYGPSWNYEVPRDRQAEWPAHAAFMDSLVEDGKILLGGPVNDGPLVLISAVSTTMNSILNKLALDPWENLGLIEDLEIKRWEILLRGD